jgi:hypothetical protein
MRLAAIACILLGVAAQNPALGINECVGTCAKKNTDGSVQLCGSCYDTDPYYDEVGGAWPYTYLSGAYGETDDFKCGVTIPTTAKGDQEAYSESYTKEVNNDASFAGNPNYECGDCKLTTLNEQWFSESFINPPADYRATDPNCVRNSNGIASVACQRQYTVLRQCVTSLKATLISGENFSPGGNAIKGGMSESKFKYEYVIGAIAVGALLVWAVVALLRKKRAASGDSKSVELSERAPADVSIPNPSHVILITNAAQLASISKEVIPPGHDPNQLPAFDSEQQYPKNDSAKLLCKKLWTSASEVEPGQQTKITSIDFEYLRERTDGFSSSHVIGEGASCKVYATTMYYGVEVAIKVLAPNASDWEVQQFTAEVELLSKVRHGNICQLYGCSTNGPQRCLVLERMSYTLEERLEMKPAMSWQQRVHVAVLACRGLMHLHSLEPKMIHRDIKSAVSRLAEIPSCGMPRFPI